MVEITQDRLKNLFKTFDSQKLIVIGDLMLDSYIWGRVNRISPEAPVPVVDVDNVSFCLGGAANVCYNVLTLGASVVPIGVIGNDNEGAILKTLFQEKGFPVHGLIEDDLRVTTVKTRIMAEGQHVVRTDREVKDPIPIETQQKIFNLLASELEEADGIILEDYNKGLLIPETIREIIAITNRSGKKVFVDPKFDHFFQYKYVTLFKPNRKEAADRLGFRLNSDENLAKAGTRLLKELECDAVMITLGEEGMILFEKNHPPMKVPTLAVHVHDVSGAGDTVIATMAVALCAGATLREAATLANHAAGIVVGEVGITPINKDRLLKTMV